VAGKGDSTKSEIGNRSKYWWIFTTDKMVKKTWMTRDLLILNEKNNHISELKKKLIIPSPLVNLEIPQGDVLVHVWMFVR